LLVVIHSASFGFCERRFAHGRLQQLVQANELVSFAAQIVEHFAEAAVEFVNPAWAAAEV
jgi:hypothetical protein